MPIYTPRGLKIRIEPQHGFSLLARLLPKVEPAHVLRTVEGMEVIPSLLAVAAGLAALTWHPTLLAITLAIFGGSFVGKIMTTFQWYVLPGIITLGRIYGYISGFGFTFVVLLGYSYMVKGMFGMAAVLVGWMLGFVIDLMIDAWSTRRQHARHGFPLTGSETNFFYAYRMYATRICAPLDIGMTSDEYETEKWHAGFEAYAKQYPEIAQQCVKTE